MTFTKDDLKKVLNVFEDIEKKAKEIFLLKYELTYGKHEGKGGIRIDNVYVDEGKIYVYAEISNCGCCTGDYQCWYIDEKYFFEDNLEKVLLDDIRVELEKVKEYDRKKQEENMKNIITLESSFNFRGEVPFKENSKYSNLTDEEEKDQLEDLIIKYPDLALKVLEKDKRDN